MLSGSAASAPAQLQRIPCSHTPNGARSQLFDVARGGCGCSHVLTCRYTVRNVVSGPAGQQTYQRRKRIRSSRAACTNISSSHSKLGCLRSAGSAATSSMPCCSSASSGLAHPPACRPQPGRSQTQLLSPRRSVYVHASLDATVQDVLMGSSVAIAIGMALYYGSKGEPEVCEGCGGAGGVRCFACDGTGAMASTDDEANLSPAQQRKGSVGGALQPRALKRGQCRACRGSGLLVCKRCNGSGYSKRM